MTIIITGASGNFGRATVEGLLERVPADQLILVTRDPSKLADFTARGCEVRRGDYDLPETLATAFEGGTRMLLMSASKVGSRIPQHKRAIDAAVAAAYSISSTPALWGWKGQTRPLLFQIIAVPKRC